MFAASPLYLCDLLKLIPELRASLKNGFKTKNTSNKVMVEIYKTIIFLSFSQSSKKYNKINVKKTLKYLENSTTASKTFKLYKIDNNTVNKYKP